MTLKAYKTPSVSVSLGSGGEPLVLHALTPADVFALFRGYRAQLSAFYDTMIELQKTGQFTLADAPGLAASMLTDIPAVAAHAIALSAGEPDERETAAGLPFAAQLECLEAVWRLTFDGAESVKKVLEIVLRYSEGANGLLKTGSIPLNGQAAPSQPRT